MRGLTEYYLSHQPRVIVAEVPEGEVPDGALAEPLEAEEWIDGWLLTAPASPARAREIMGGLAKVQNRLPSNAILLYPYDNESLVQVLANWFQGLEHNPEVAAFLGEEVEDNPEAYANLLQGEKTLWRGFKELVGFQPEGKAAIPAIEAYEALLERGLDEFRREARGNHGDLPPETIHRLSNEAKRLLIKEKRKALAAVLQSL